MRMNKRFTIGLLGVSMSIACWPWIPIYTSHPIKGRKLYRPLILIWLLKIPFR